MRESALENKLKIHVESLNGKCWKWVSPGLRGVPDRVCFFPNGKIIFVEMKASGKTSNPMQLKRHKELRNLGFDVRVIDLEEQIYALQPA